LIPSYLHELISSELAYVPNDCSGVLLWISLLSQIIQDFRKCDFQNQKGGLTWVRSLLKVYSKTCRRSSHRIWWTIGHGGEFLGFSPVFSVSVQGDGLRLMLFFKTFYFARCQDVKISRLHLTLQECTSNITTVDVDLSLSLFHTISIPSSHCQQLE